MPTKPKFVVSITNQAEHFYSGGNEEFPFDWYIHGRVHQVNTKTKATIFKTKKDAEDTVDYLYDSLYTYANEAAIEAMERDGFYTDEEVEADNITITIKKVSHGSKTIRTRCNPNRKQNRKNNN